MIDSNKVLWPGWETVRMIGRGSFGAVYEIEQDVYGHKEKAALKVISIPQNDRDIDELYDSGYDKAGIASTFQAAKQSVVDEYTTIQKLNGTDNVVECDGLRVEPHDDNLGWDISVKMELLTPITRALDRNPEEWQAQQIGRDICRALILCEKCGIVHRNIKPQNIFASHTGYYKLGDFGTIKTMERTSGSPKVGTYKYMAPEIYNNKPYDQRADIYSLGLVLHWMLNERRTPFAALPPEPVLAPQEDRARLRRLQGEPIPAPAHGSRELQQIVLKACAYDPRDRYQHASEMLAALEKIQEVSPRDKDVPEEEEPTIGVDWRKRMRGKK